MAGYDLGIMTRAACQPQTVAAWFLLAGASLN